jgi:formyltetrahydrofolate deformylase
VTEPSEAERRSAIGTPRRAGPKAERADIGRLLLSCPDRHGIVAAVSGFLADVGANIVSSDQYSTDPEGGAFFLRVEYHLPGLEERRAELEAGFAEIGDRFRMRWRMTVAAERKRVALLVSRYEHCLLDLLWRWRSGQLDCEVVGVVSNHLDLRADVAGFDVPYHHVPVTKETKQDAERRMLELLAGNVELIVLARYMQILSGGFLDAVGCPVINIHHSFLPAFMGANPYVRAHARGVKLIGATAHYATVDLDEGPIIEQDVLRVTHRQAAAELEQAGQDVERTVLARAVQWHLADRVIVHDSRTVVFA